jgi:hypothetical protein
VSELLAFPDAVQDVVLIAVQLGGDQPIDGRADHLFRRIAKDPLGRCIPGEHGAVERLADDGIVGRLDDRGESSPGQVGG